MRIEQISYLSYHCAAAIVYVSHSVHQVNEVRARYLVVSECVFGTVDQPLPLNADNDHEDFDQDHNNCLDLGEFQSLRRQFLASGLARLTKKGFKDWLANPQCVPDEDVNLMATEFRKRPDVSGSLLWNIGSRVELQGKLVKALPYDLQEQQHAAVTGSGDLAYDEIEEAESRMRGEGDYETTSRTGVAALGGEGGERTFLSESMEETQAETDPNGRHGLRRRCQLWSHAQRYRPA